MRKQRKIRIGGQVQGVFFRAAARNEAERLGLTGLARNEPDGSVYIEVEGEPALLTAFERWCHDGPPQARVEYVTSQEDEPKGYQTFETR